MFVLDLSVVDSYVEMEMRGLQNMHRYEHSHSGLGNEWVLCLTVDFNKRKNTCYTKHLI